MSTELEHKRHTLAHLLAAAVMQMYPDAKRTIGPAIDDGFYFDFEFPTTKPGDADLAKIEKAMRKLLPSWKSFERSELDAAAAKAEYPGNQYKHELIDEFTKDGSKVSFYKSGHYSDLCRGGHSDNPAAEIASDSFKLDRIAGAYWRGDEKNTMLTRIYGLAFDTKDELDAHITQREEAKKRDHRKIGQEQNLFVISDLVGAGLPLFTPKGTIIRDEISNLLWELNKKHGYDKVDIPHVAKHDLYKVSGHWDKYKDDGFLVHGRDKEFMLKPMNCPHHTQIYASVQRSYRNLPVRYFEVTKVYRDEQSGELLGLSRVLSITQDDGHVFCTPEQIEAECDAIVSIIKDFYTVFGMLHEGSYRARLSVRDPKTPDKYLGDPSVWDMAEEKLAEIGAKHKLQLERGEGEAAFYGPKLDFMFKDAIGREWQLATIQLDFVQPERFTLEYTNDRGAKVRPVMIHRAISGSLERFISVIIEHFGGAFPLWLSPVQAVIVPVSEKHVEYARTVRDTLAAAGLRIELDDANESLGKRIRAAKQQKVPYVLVVGDKEVEANSVSVESRTESIGAMPLTTLTDKLVTEHKTRAL